MLSHGETWEDRGERGWRRVVASPEPLEVLDAPAVVTLVDAGFVVVANGGGGIPTVRDPDGSVAAKYGVMMGTRPMARRVTIVIDDKGLLRRIDEKVDVTNHGADLVALIKRLRK